MEFGSPHSSECSSGTIVFRHGLHSRGLADVGGLSNNPCMLVWFAGAPCGLQAASFRRGIGGGATMHRGSYSPHPAVQTNQPQIYHPRGVEAPMLRHPATPPDMCS